VLRQVPVTVASVGEPVESWQASIGLEAEWKGSTRFRSWRVEMADSAARLFDVDVRGERELRVGCERRPLTARGVIRCAASTSCSRSAAAR